MAVVAVSPSVVRVLGGVGRPPVWVLGTALLAPSLDLLFQLQREAWLQHGATAGAAAAAIVLMAALARCGVRTWLVAAALAYVASAAIRVFGLDGGPWLSILAVMAMGVGGVFREPLPYAASEPLATPIESEVAVSAA